MHTLTARRGAFLLVVILLLISILLEQAIAALVPWLGQLGSIRPMIVFLDIPLEAPVTIDWLPVGFIFLLFYGLVGAGNAGEKPKGEIRGRGWAILGRWWLLLILLLAGGGLYYGLSGFLPKEVRNGLDSFGMRADIVLPYPSGETMHLHGSMIMLACFLLGWRLLLNTAATRSASVPHGDAAPVVAAPPGKPAPVMAAPPAKPVAPIVTAAVAALPVTAAARTSKPAGAAISAGRRITMQIPEPVEIQRTESHTAVLDAPPPRGRTCVHVAMPDSLSRRRRSFPCVVDGGVRPVSAAAKHVVVRKAL